MKNLLKTALCMTLAILAAACGSKVPSPDEVANRINSNDRVSQADYAAIIDYCGKYAKSAQGYYNEINAQPNDSTPEAIKAASGLSDLYSSYEYLELFRSKLSATPLADLDADNQQKVKQYAQYQGFPLPEGESLKLQDPNVVGMIEQTPYSDSSDVIATGAGEAVDN